MLRGGGTEVLPPSRAATKILGALAPLVSAPAPDRTFQSQQTRLLKREPPSGGAQRGNVLLEFLPSLRQLSVLTPRRPFCSRRHATWGVKVLESPKLPTKACIPFTVSRTGQTCILAIATSKKTSALPDQTIPQNFTAGPGP